MSSQEGYSFSNYHASVENNFCLKGNYYWRFVGFFWGSQNCDDNLQQDLTTCCFFFPWEPKKTSLLAVHDEKKKGPDRRDNLAGTFENASSNWRGLSKGYVNSHDDFWGHGF